MTGIPPRGFLSPSTTEPLAPDVVLDPVPDPEQQQPLSAEEVQDLRRMINASPATASSRPIAAISGNSGFLIPQLNITDADLDSFINTLMEGTQYSETLVRYGGKLSVKFRVRSRIEEEILLAQLNQDMKDGLIHSDMAYYARVNLYNLTAQVEALDGVVQIPDPILTLRKRSESGIFGSMAEPKLYILVTLLAQFEDKVSRMARKALAEPDFSDPATAT